MHDWERLNFVSEAAEREAFEAFLDERRSNTTISLDTYIDEVNLSVRTSNCLTKVGIKTIGDFYWYVTRLGDQWGNRIRSLGEVSQKEAEDILLSEQIPLVDSSNRKSRIDYLINTLESRRHFLSEKIRTEIADYLRELLQD